MRGFVESLSTDTRAGWPWGRAVKSVGVVSRGLFRFTSIVNIVAAMMFTIQAARQGWRAERGKEPASVLIGAGGELIWPVVWQVSWKIQRDNNQYIVWRQPLCAITSPDLLNSPQLNPPELESRTRTQGIAPLRLHHSVEI